MVGVVGVGALVGVVLEVVGMLVEDWGSILLGVVKRMDVEG